VNSAKLEGQVALITGAARGQGASHAEYLAREGATIVALDICADISPVYPLATRDELDRTVDAINDFGGEAIAIVADVRSSSEMRNAAERAVAEFGRIDILCNNAGTCVIEGLEEMTDAGLDAVLDVNLKGVFNATRAVAGVMKRQRSGRIINTASAAASKPQPYISAYAASKGGVVLATKAWAAELAEWEINVNGIAPGTIVTQMVTGMIEQAGQTLEDTIDAFHANHLFKGERGRISVEDISKVVVFLASEDARMITGHVIAVDAGFAAS
jgi:NAD(P)-dependent dehydrogenase (short-subunit alcohol dehydrogenase family)